MTTDSGRATQKTKRPDGWLPAAALYAWLLVALLAASGGEWDLSHAGEYTVMRDVIWSPDGRQVIAVMEAGGEQGVMLHALTLESNQPASLWSQPLPRAWIRPKALAWRPERNLLLLSADQGDGKTWILDFRSGNPLPLTPALRFVDYVSVGPRHVAYASGEQTWLAPLDGGSPLLLTAGNTAVAWSPDGERMLFTRGADIIAADAAGGGQLVFARGKIYATSWSPDGREVAFIREGGVWLIGADGDPASEQRLMTYGCGNCKDIFAWAPDSTRLAARSGHGLYVIQRDGSAQKYLADTNWWNWSWSPDSRYLAFGDIGGIYMANTATGVVHKMPGHNSPMGAHAWSPDGAYLALANSDGFSEHVPRVAFFRPDGTARVIWSSLAPEAVLSAAGSALGWLLLWDLGLIVGLFAPNPTVRRHAQQALAAALVILAGLAAIVGTGLAQDTNTSAQYGAWKTTLTLLAVALGWWQVRSGDCWLMRLLGESGELPRPWATRTPVAAPVDAQPPQPPAALPLSVPSAVPADNWVAPIDPLSALQQGHEMLRQGRRAEAIICLNIALRGDPNVRQQAADELVTLGELERF